MAEKIIYFGGEKILQKPELAEEGFVCTEDASAAKERAGRFRRGGILNLYALDTDGLGPGDFEIKRKEVRLKTQEALGKLRFLGFGPVDVPEKRKRGHKAEEENPSAVGKLLVYLKNVKKEEPENFFRLLRISGLAEDWESGMDLSLPAEEPACIYRAVMTVLGQEPMEQEEEAIPEDPKTQWVGDVLEYLQKQTGKSFSSILEDISIRELEVFYEPLKALSVAQCYLVIREKIRQKGKKTWIQRMRRRSGLSQRELAEKSGVNLRTLQQYEIRDKDIDKAAAGKVLSMARVLSCRPEELMEW